jgi:hypothetical protein
MSCEVTPFFIHKTVKNYTLFLLSSIALAPTVLVFLQGVVGTIFNYLLKQSLPLPLHKFGNDF